MISGPSLLIITVEYTRYLFQDELTVQACVIYHHILMYMGDIPGRRTRLGIELTDVIFDGPLKQVNRYFIVIKSYE